MDMRALEILGFFDPAVLAPYREQPDKYSLTTDHFEGRVTLTAAYFRQVDERGRGSEYIDVQFGYRTLKSGDLAIAAYLPDLVDHSPSHVERWRPFLTGDVDWLEYEQDLRFSLWVRRYLEGDWEVDNGPAFQLVSEIKLINGLTCETVGIPLFEVEEPHIPYPTAQNTHRYEDAHRELYGALIDGLKKDCITSLGEHLQRPVKMGDKWSLIGLKKLFSAANETVFAEPLANVEAQRRLAAHGVRPPARAMRAFEQFTADLESCQVALHHLRTTLETELGLDAEKAAARQDALKRMPSVARPPESNYSINQAVRMQGRTVDKVEFGFRRDIEGVHQSELLIIRFTDGSIMSIDTGSNAANLRRTSKPTDFHVSFHVHWVPPKV